MNPFKKMLISVAAPSKTFHHDLSKRHTTTTDFFQLDCAYCREVIPNEKVKVSMVTDARLAALALPSFVDVDLHQRAFFVPFRTIMPAWQDFINDSVHTTANNQSGLVQNVVRVTNNALVEALRNPILSQEVTPTDETLPDGRVKTNWDFQTISGSSSPFTTKYYYLTAKGRHFYKILRQLGYQLMFDITARTQSVYFSALPLLAYVKVFCDWFYPSAYGDSTDLQDLIKIFKRDNSLSPTLTSADILTIAIKLNNVPYENDYFTSAFDTPVGPRMGNFTTTRIEDITSNSSIRSQVANFNEATFQSTPIIQGLNGSTSSISPANLSQYVLDTLKSLTDYAKRHQLAGAQAFERFLARWGVELKDTHRSVYIGSNRVPLIVSDIFSTSETTSTSDEQQGASLGDYAGKGFIQQDKPFSFDFDSNGDQGILLVLTNLQPRVGYVQGVRRHCLHLSKLDFATPEFDCLGNRAILPAELYLPLRGDSPLYTDWNKDAAPFNTTFGFTPQYSEYKVEHDDLSGDFALQSLSVAGFTSKAWHLARLFNDESFGGDNLPVHSLSFVFPEDAQQYDRIFSYAPELGYLGVRADHFVMTHLIKVDLYNHLKPLFDTYEFKNEDESNKVNISPNGETLN